MRKSKGENRKWKGKGKRGKGVIAYNTKCVLSTQARR